VPAKVLDGIPQNYLTGLVVYWLPLPLVSVIIDPMINDKGQKMTDEALIVLTIGCGLLAGMAIAALFQLI